eukprot:9171299-Ditylum_brightwellii.AAC.1
MDTTDPQTIDIPLIQGIPLLHQAEVDNTSLSMFGSAMFRATQTQDHQLFTGQSTALAISVDAHLPMWKPPLPPLHWQSWSFDHQ